MILTIISQKDTKASESFVVELGKSLIKANQRVLLIDMDPEFGFSKFSKPPIGPTMAEALEGRCEIRECFNTQGRLTVVAASPQLVKTEFEMIKSSNRFMLMKNALQGALGFDYVIVDCTPTHALLALNALVSSSHMVVALPMSVNALRDLDSLLFTIENIKPYNVNLKMLGVLPVVSPGEMIAASISEYINTNYAIKVMDRFAAVNSGEFPDQFTNKYDWLAAEVIKASKSIQIVHPN